MDQASLSQNQEHAKAVQGNALKPHPLYLPSYHTTLCNLCTRHRLPYFSPTYIMIHISVLARYFLPARIPFLSNLIGWD